MGPVLTHTALSEPCNYKYTEAVLKAPYVFLDIDNPGVNACTYAYILYVEGEYQIAHLYNTLKSLSFG